MPRSAPFATRFARRAMVCAVDHHAVQAGIWVLREGGTAVDAAVAASAVLAVTAQHLCGMGGDLFALVHSPGREGPVALNASGRSGSGADPDRLRRRGLHEMPMWEDVSAVPVPGCVDGWTTLHGRFGRLPIHQVLDPAIGYAEDGFPSTHLLAAAAPRIAALPGAGDFAAATRPGALIRRPGVARTLRAIAAGGRGGFYEGEFGAGLLALGAGEYTRGDLAETNADWVEPVAVEAWGTRLWSVPPNSQGYLTLSGAWIAGGLELPEDADDPLWAHLLIEAARQAAYDRLDVLHEGADGSALLSPDRLGPRRSAIDPDRAAELGRRENYRAGGTCYLCVVDSDGMGVSLIQSNATGFGSRLVEAGTGVFLHNRGLGFSLVPGHPAEYGPRRRPPSTLSPIVVTDGENGALKMVAGTMGGDSQPQILLQLLARVLHNGEPVGDAVAAPRWALEGVGDEVGFDTWREAGRVNVGLEPNAPASWQSGLEQRGHRTRTTRTYGHAHAIVWFPDHLEGASDPRALAGEAAGY